MSARATCRCGWTRTYPTRAAAEFNARRHVCREQRNGVRRATRRYRCARCGHEAVYENAGAVESRYWFRRHSCRRVEAAWIRAAMAEDRAASIDRTPKPCQHKQANHLHGTNAAYVLDRCRCKPCTRARSVQGQWRARQKAYGRYHKYVPADPVRDHVRALTDAGLGLKRVATVTGVSQGALWKLMYGNPRTDGTRVPSRRVLRTTAEKLYALDPAWSPDPLPLAGGAVLSAEASQPTHRRLQALVALGWSMTELGRRLGLTSGANIIPAVKGERPVTVATSRRVEALFTQLAMTLPPAQTRHHRASAERARRLARAHGWVPPLALDDLDVDPHDYVHPHRAHATDDCVDEVAVLRRLDGDKTVRVTPAEAAEVLRRWQASGRSLAEAERTTGLNSHRVLRTACRSAEANLDTAVG